jgi:hypothetical protein
MGRKLVLTGTTLTDLTAPKLATLDPMESIGSLLLLEPMHPAQQWPAGVPADASSLPNIFWETAQDILGSGTEATLSAYVRNVWTTVTNAVKERTTKGGLHVIHPTTAGAAHEALNIAVPAAIKTYMKANPTHQFYMSQWNHITRAATTSTSDILAVISSNSQFAAGFGQKQNWPAVNLGVRPFPGNSVAGKSFRNVLAVPEGTFATDTDIETTANPYNRAAFIIGSRSANAVVGKQSAIFYRAYLEDVTVSGRTYAELDAMDYALYEQHVLLAGGRYYGDTYTNPSTVP